MPDEDGARPGAVDPDTPRADRPVARPRVIVCDVGGVVAPDLHTVDALARAQLAAWRLGLVLRLRGANSELEDLLDLCGLRDVLRIEE
jgi:anti-anti-sigma regulatory factor